MAAAGEQGFREQLAAELDKAKAALERAIADKHAPPVVMGELITARAHIDHAFDFAEEVQGIWEEYWVEKEEAKDAK